MSERHETVGRLINTMMICLVWIWELTIGIYQLICEHFKKESATRPQKSVIIHKKKVDEERPISSVVLKRSDAENLNDSLVRRVKSVPNEIVEVESPSITVNMPMEETKIVQQTKNEIKKEDNVSRTSAIIVIEKDSMERRRHSSGTEEYLRKGELNARLATSKTATELDLSDFGFVLLPFKLRSCFMLHTLDLSFNKLSTLPPWFSNNMSPTLRRLNLSGNLFFEIPASFASLQLEEINLSRNKFEYFPNVVVRISTLKAISIHHNSLLFLPAEIKNLKNLTHLNVSHNLLSRLPDELVQLTQLTTLLVHGNNYIGSNFKILQALFELNPNLEREMMIAEERDMEGSSKKKKRSFTVASVVTPLAESLVTSLETLVDSPKAPTVSSSPQINIEKRIHGLLEILESERKYTRYLGVLYSQYYLPLTKDNPQPNVKISPPQLRFSSINLPQETIRQIFPQGLVQIVNFNTSLLNELNRLIDVPQDGGDLPSPTKINECLIGPLFIELAPFLKLYTSYVAQYEKAHQALSGCFKNYPEFKKVVDEGVKIPEANGLALSDILIMPIQRIPRYLLLLQAVFQHTHPSHPDYDNLNTAIKKVQEVASYVNKKIEETSNRLKVVEVAEELGQLDLVEPHRHFIREGKLKLHNVQEEESEFKVYLLSDMIILKEFKTLLQGIREYSINSILTGGIVNNYSLVGAEVFDIDNPSSEIQDFKVDEFALKVFENKQRMTVYRFAASSEQLRKVWVNKFKELLAPRLK